MHKEDVTQTFHTALEAAQILRVNYDTVIRMLKQGHLKGKRFGRQWRIPASALRIGSDAVSN